MIPSPRDMATNRRHPSLRRRRFAACLPALAAFLIAAAPAASDPDVVCKAEEPVTVAARVEMAQVLQDVYALTDEQGERLFVRGNATLDRKLAEIFDPAAPRSKLEQFYAMLFLIAQHTSHPAREVFLDAVKARTLLVTARVFSDPEFPRHITRIKLVRQSGRPPRFEVRFDRAEVRLPLNKGRGFGVFREGMCQHAKALVFYGGFAFSLASRSGGLQVYDFEGVDLWGDFGTRGLVDIDLNYVSVRSVEFLKGSALGLVKAKVSPREFEVNNHFFLLELITKFVTDKSIQPIDW